MSGPLYHTVHGWRNGGGISVSIGSTATDSPAMPTGTTFARLVSTVDCWIELGGGATASAGTGGYLPAFVIEYVSIPASAQVSVVRANTDGILYIKPCVG